MGIEEQLLDMAEKRGEKIGEKRGEKIGEKRGEEKGIQKGKEKAYVAIIHDLIYDYGFSEEDTAKVTGLSLDDVKKYRIRNKSKPDVIAGVLNTEGRKQTEI